MLSKSTIRFIRSLRDQKFRQKYHKIPVEGLKSVHDILRDNLLVVETLYAVSLPGEIRQLVPHTTEVVIVSEDELARISSFTTPQQILAVCTMPEQTTSLSGLANQLTLYLDGIRDPGNAGTIFRIADWFGVRHIGLSPDCVDPYNPKVIQASMGSLFRISWAEVELDQIIAQNPGIPVYITSLDGEDVYSAKELPAGILLLGNESTGVRNLRIDAGTVHRISIPSTYRLGADSLNVAIAAAVLCAEFRRRGTTGAGQKS